MYLFEFRTISPVIICMNLNYFFKVTESDVEVASPMRHPAWQARNAGGDRFFGANASASGSGAQGGEDRGRGGNLRE
jgi:hypothetical protein